MSQPARVGDRMRPGEAGGIDDDGEHERLQDELLELEHRIASTRARSLTGAPPGRMGSSKGEWRGHEIVTDTGLQ
jgi:hypothetical protein